MTDQLSIVPKFEVGQFVQLISDNPLGVTAKSTYHIIERAIQECPAGSQVWYTCRGHHLKYRERTVNLQCIKFNEIELQEMENPAPDKDADLKSQVVALLKKVEEMEDTPMD